MRRVVETMSEIREDRVNFPKGNHAGEPGKDFIRKSDLVDGEYYYGHCRNSKCARWSTANQEFTYMRTKFNDRFPDIINHPEDDDGYDLFVPYFKCYPTIDDLVPDDIDESEQTTDERVVNLTKGIP